MKKKPKALLLNPSFRYTNSEDSMKPGYLAAKFAALIKAQKKPAAAGNVVAIAKKKG